MAKKLRVTINERHNSSPKYKINEIVELYFLYNSCSSRTNCFRTYEKWDFGQILNAIDGDIFTVLLLFFELKNYGSQQMNINGGIQKSVKVNE